MVLGLSISVWCEMVSETCITFIQVFPDICKAHLPCLQLPMKLNECDDEGNIPLNLALLNRHEEIANSLVSNSCDLDIVDPNGNSLLHLAILRGDTFAASFLIKSGANSILARKTTLETPLHLVSAYNPSQVSWTNISALESCQYGLISH